MSRPLKSTISQVVSELLSHRIKKATASMFDPHEWIGLADIIIFNNIGIPLTAFNFFYKLEGRWLQWHWIHDGFHTKHRHCAKEVSLHNSLPLIFSWSLAQTYPCKGNTSGLAVSIRIAGVATITCIAGVATAVTTRLGFAKRVDLSTSGVSPHRSRQPLENCWIHVRFQQFSSGNCGIVYSSGFKCILEDFVLNYSSYL